MNLRSAHVFLFACVGLVFGAAADDARLSKAQELTQARDFVSKLGAANRLSKRPLLGVLSYWELRINTYSDDFDQQLERSTLYPLYSDCCRAMERLYGAKPTTYLAEDLMGFPSQMTIVEFDDVDFGKSHLIAGLWEGNDSTGFYFDCKYPDLAAARAALASVEKMLKLDMAKVDAWIQHELWESASVLKLTAAVPDAEAHVELLYRAGLLGQTPPRESDCRLIFHFRWDAPPAPTPQARRPIPSNGQQPAQPQPVR